MPSSRRRRAGAVEVINSDGLANWNNANTITTAYFRMASAGSVTVGLNAYLAGSNNSSVKVTIHGTAFTVQLAGTTAKTYPVGTVNVTAPGYVKVEHAGRDQGRWLLRRRVGLERDHDLCARVRQ
jgi:hypothetical protein